MQHEQTQSNAANMQVVTFNSFAVNQVQSFDISLAHFVRPDDLLVSITNPIIGSLDKQLNWINPTTQNNQQNNEHQVFNKCIVSFKAPIVGIYSIKVELFNQPTNQANNSNCVTQFQAKAYDLGKVFINGSSGQCRVNESYEFGVDASEAGEGQLEIAVNEGEIPNQVQVLDNGKCIVNFVPEEAVPHVVDIKFNGHNVNGCPFVVQVMEAMTNDQIGAASTTVALDARPIEPALEPKLIKNERVLVNTLASFTLENINLKQIDRNEICVLDPENKPIEYNLIDCSTTRQSSSSSFKFEFKPHIVGDYSIELKPVSGGQQHLANVLPANILDAFPFSMKVFDFNKVIVSDVTDGVVGHPIYFFIDASQAGSGNLEIRVSSRTRNVPNYPQSEANARIRVNFTPTEAVEHSIDVKFNGISVPNNPFLVKVSQFPRARVPIMSQDILKYVALNEPIEFYVEYISITQSDHTKNINPIQTENQCCQVLVVRPDFTSFKLDNIQLINKANNKQTTNQQDKLKFKIKFEANKIGPYKLFIIVDNELIPGSPILTNVYNIHEVKVSFEKPPPPPQVSDTRAHAIGKINEPVTFTVDASRAGEGTLALAVVSSSSKVPVQTDVRVSEKGHGLYNLTFVPLEFAAHSIDMSFNDRVVPHSPFIVDILNSKGESSLALPEQKQETTPTHHQTTTTNNNTTSRDHVSSTLTRNMAAMSVHDDETNQINKSSHNNSLQGQKSSSIKGKAPSLNKEDEFFQNIVVHGISLKRTPVNSTGAFIIETNRMAHARDFDVLIADPSNSLVDVQCYLQPDGNLLAEWTPERVGTHKIEVLFKNKPVPGSPFITEAFDPAAVSLITPRPSDLLNCSLGTPIEFKLNCKQAGQADLEASVFDPNGQEHSIEVLRAHQANQTSEQEKDEVTSEQHMCDVLRFEPKVAGKHKLNVTFGGYDVPKTPVIFSVHDTREPLVRVTGPGLRCAEVNRSALFSVDSSTSGDGELKLRIECGDREIVPKVERKGRVYHIKYKPVEIGHASVSVYWNGQHIDGSPYLVPVNDLSCFAFIDSINNNILIKNQIVMDYEPRQAREITVDTSSCGPGELKAEAYCRANQAIKFSIPVNQVASNRYKLIFTCPPGIEQLAKGADVADFPVEATYLIRFFYNNLAVPETLASVSLTPPSHDKTRTVSTNNNNNNNSINNGTLQQAGAKTKTQTLRREQPVVALRGHGLVEAKCNEQAEFTIDGRNVGRGKPEVKLYSNNNHANEVVQQVAVKLELVDDNIYKATYVCRTEGKYTLNVLWDNKQVAGCPVTVCVSAPSCDSTKVVCTADSLKGGVLGDEIKTFIDTRKAGAGELTALCTGPQKVAFCELLDRGDGTFILFIKPQESGRHFLTINYGGQHIPKSPFSFKVSGKPDPTRVHVYGPGVEHGVLSFYQSRFVCDTRGAGAGQLTVRIRGPKGAFRMETQRENQRDRTILCKYDPTEPGDYRIEIKWSGRHVPGSPFSVMIFDTQEELNRFLLSRQQQAANMTQQTSVSRKLNNTNGSAAPFPTTLVDYGHYSSSNNSAATLAQPTQFSSRLQ